MHTLSTLGNDTTDEAKKRKVKVNPQTEPEGTSHSIQSIFDRKQNKRAKYKLYKVPAGKTGKP